MIKNKRNKTKFERKNNMRDTITLIEMSELVNTVVSTVFIENEVTGQIDYRPEYVPVVRDFIKMKYYSPDELETDSINDFYSSWINGGYRETLDRINPLQNNEIDMSIDKKIDYVKTQVGNPLNNALASLINIIQDGIDVFSSSFGNLTADDINKVMSQANSIVSGIDKNAKNVVKAVTENVTEKMSVEINNDKKTHTNTTITKSRKKNNSKTLKMPMPSDSEVTDNGKQ